MTKLQFQKWQATGNDFVVIDNRSGAFSSLTAKQIELLCDRKFGVGSDGLMMIQNHQELDFEMRYFNADGLEAEMCGNGARSIIAFAQQLGIISEKTSFMAMDGRHDGWILNENEYRVQMVNVEINDPNESKLSIFDPQQLFLNTGVPHLVIFADDINEIDIVKRGRELRYSPEFQPSGTNVNFARIHDNGIAVRTYERGVENETLSCGTGAVASAIASVHLKHSGREAFPTRSIIPISVPGGLLEVEFTRTTTIRYENIYLSGPAKMVFHGTFNLQ